LYIKNEINVPDIEIFISLNDNLNIIIDVSLTIINRYSVRRMFTKQEFCNNDLYAENELQYWCKYCAYELNKKKKELRKGIK